MCYLCEESERLHSSSGSRRLRQVEQKERVIAHSDLSCECSLLSSGNSLRDSTFQVLYEKANIP